MTDTSDAPRVKVRTFVNGKRQEPLFHPLTLGLLFRDPPEIQLENDARDRAKKGLEKSWIAIPDHVIEAEREMLSEQHANLVTEGLHKGRVNFITGLVEPFLVTDLPSKESIAKENVFVSNDNTSLPHVYAEMRSASCPRLSAKINIYVDRFMYVVSSSTPLTRQRDMDERSYSILSFGLNRPQPDAFFFPASYLCCTIFFEDVRMHEHGAIWKNDSWKPSTKSSSSIEIFNFQAS